MTDKNQLLSQGDFVTFMRDPNNSMASQTTLIMASLEVLHAIYEDIKLNQGSVTVQDALVAFYDYNCMTATGFVSCYAFIYPELWKAIVLDDVINFIVSHNDFTYVATTDSHTHVVFKD